MSVSTRELARLHDATLRYVQLEWATGLVTLVIRTFVEGERHLPVYECTELVVPRREEWGRSQSVLSVSYLEGDPARGLVVEMQSGDRLVIRGRVGDWVLVH